MNPVRSPHFDAEDPRFHWCSCCCNIHVSQIIPLQAMAHLIALIWILIDIVFFGILIISTGSFRCISLCLVVVLLWVGPIQGNRSGLAALLVVLGGFTVLLAVFDAALIYALGSGELSPEVYSITLKRVGILSLTIGAWIASFVVWWRFYKYLVDEEASDGDKEVSLEEGRDYSPQRSDRQAIEYDASTPLQCSTRPVRQYGKVEGCEQGRARLIPPRACDCRPPEYEEPPPSYEQVKQ